MANDYHDIRIEYDQRRSVLWKTLTEYFFQAYVQESYTVVELGAGYCDFINNIKADTKFAIDIWPGVERHAANGVKCIVGDLLELDALEDDSVDFVFASNIFEHITQDKLSQVLAILYRKLKRNGKLCVLQPNFSKSYRQYFDDYTHVSIWTATGLSDFLRANQFRMTLVKPGFLPLSIKSNFPVHPLLIRLYLNSPFKPLAKQMLLLAELDK